MKYYLKVRKESPSKFDKTCQVQLYYVNNTLVPLKLDTTVHVKPENFKDNQVTENDERYLDKNKILNRCLLTTHKLLSNFYAENDRNPTPEEFRSIYIQRINQGDVKNNLIDLFEYWIKNIYTRNDKRVFYTVLNSLKDNFSPSLTLGDLNSDVLNKIRHTWIHQKVKTKKKFTDQKGMFDSTTKKRWQSFKQFLKYQDATEFKPHPDYLTFKINLASIPSRENIFHLYMPEFKVLFNADLPPHLAYVRNLYCLACFTGLRISDIQKVSTDSVITNHEDVDVIQLVTQKGNKSTAIPLFKYSREIIFNRLKDPKRISAVHIEKHLHTIFEMLVPKMPPSFVKKTQYFARNDNKDCSFFGKKYEFLSFHTSRKFFATYMCAKTSYINVMSWGCWESFDAFRRYMGKPIDEKKTVDSINDSLDD